MSDAIMPSHRKWRERVQRETDHLARTEALADILIEQGLPAGFECRRWVDHSIDWCDFDLSLQEFAGRVKAITLIFGPPESVETTYLGGHASNAEERPNLEARWNLKIDGTQVNVTVRAMSPTGCKLDPRSEFQSVHIDPTIHSECRAVLTSLED